MGEEELGALIVRIEANMQGLVDGFSKAEKKVSVFGDVFKANILSSAITGGLNKIGQLMGNAADKLGDFASMGIETASNLQEVQNRVPLMLLVYLN